MRKCVWFQHHGLELQPATPVQGHLDVRHPRTHWLHSGWRSRAGFPHKWQFRVSSLWPPEKSTVRDQMQILSIGSMFKQRNKRCLQWRFLFWTESWRLHADKVFIGLDPLYMWSWGRVRFAAVHNSLDELSNMAGLGLWGGDHVVSGSPWRWCRSLKEFCYYCWNKNKWGCSFPLDM